MAGNWLPSPPCRGHPCHCLVWDRGDREGLGREQEGWKCWANSAAGEQWVFITRDIERGTVWTSSPRTLASSVSKCPGPIRSEQGSASALPSEQQGAASGPIKAPPSSEIPNFFQGSSYRLAEGGSHWEIWAIGRPLWPHSPTKMSSLPLGSLLGSPTSFICPAAAWMKERTSPGTIHFCGEQGRALRGPGPEL